MNRKNVIIIAAIVVALTFTSCSKEQSQKTVTVKEDAVITTPVSVSTVEAGTITQYHKFGGTVTAKDSVTILPDAAGKIASILVEEGTEVTKDQVIATVDPSRAGQKYNFSPVKSTLDGTVTKVNVSYGSTVSQASPIAVVQTLDDLEISFNVIEKYVNTVKKGNKAIVTFDAFPGEVFGATITYTSPTLDTTTRSRSIKAKLDKDDDRVIAGMYARLNVITEEKDDVVVIPYSAVTVTNDSSYVFIISGDQAVKTEVEIGIREGSNAEITKGLKAGDKLVTRGQTLLSDGAKVRIINN
ncbi:MAG: efflux RND transporter periplasmic adaptor subunit [Sphaerochaetaceae bacterium]|nr:efflux RND transporter periplasmic adaptor subunit [Sphaerochaetaceae bacterium]